MDFSAHNILLSNGQKTIPTIKNTLSESMVMKAVKSSLNNFINLKENEAKNIKIVDIGCMEGGYSSEFAKMGFNTLGIDARKENLLKSTYIKLNLKLNNLKFVKDDARNLAKYGEFDISFCFGLLYHLDNPINFLKIVANQTKKMLILHTYYAYDEKEDYQYYLEHSFNKVFKNINSQKRKEFNESEYQKDKYTPYIQYPKNYDLSKKITENEGYKGRWFHEWREDTKQERIEAMHGAAYNNNKSFWLCKSEIIRALYDSGFSNVYEQLDDIGELSRDTPSFYYPRTLLVAIKN
ncbi:MAG: methyltransferase domain-containing protein [Candidatus Sericytochromatia bacterium]